MRHSREYKRYLESERWQQFRRQVLHWHNHRCALCGTDSKILQVHHLNYVRLGHERLTDCVPLCIPCHERADADRQKTIRYKGRRIHRRR
jgi:5-methylcytosine-specific restriction endonuclease McrA